MDIAQTWRWLTHVKSHPWYLSQMPITDKSLCLSAGIDQSCLEHARKGRSEVRTLTKIARIIPDIEERRLCFYKPPAKNVGFVWLNPPPAIIPRYTQRSYWSLAARCNGCGNNKFLACGIKGDRRKWVACYHCIPPESYPVMGFTLHKMSLIHEALKKTIGTCTMPYARETSLQMPQPKLHTAERPQPHRAVRSDELSYPGLPGLRKH